MHTYTHTHTHKGLDGVADVVSSMEHYDLLRSDWDVVSEMGLFKGKPDYAAQIPTKVYIHLPIGLVVREIYPLGQP